MNPLVKNLITLSLCLWTAIVAYGQNTITGYASCDGAALNTYMVIIDASDLSSTDQVSIGGVAMTKVDGSNQLVFGPYNHSGTGMAHQQVQLNGADAIEVLETLCGLYTQNGLHASGAGCTNVDYASTGFILAQSQPGTFQNDDVHTQTYILADDMNNYLTSNMTGLFEDLSSGDYNVFAVNVLTAEATSFVDGLSLTSDLVEYMNISPSCSSVCGNVAVNVGCSDDPILVQIDPEFDDPCFCTNPLNEFNPDGTILYLHDVVEISMANDADVWTFQNPTTEFYYQPSPGNFVLVESGIVIPSIGGGIHQLEIYHKPNVGWESDIFAASGPNSGFEFVGISNVCTNCDGVQIPTMGQWLLFILALLLMNLALITLYNNRRALSNI